MDYNPAEELIKIYEQTLVDKNNSEHRDYKVFHPSSWGACVRKTAFQYLNYPSVDTLEPRVLRIFDTGRSLEDRVRGFMIQNNIIYGKWKCLICGHVAGEDEDIGILKPEYCPGCQKENSNENPILKYEEITLSSKEYNFRGSCDGIIVVNNDKHVLEIKSINENNFSNYLIKPKTEHYIQINIYMWLSGVPRGIIYYENKNDQSLKLFNVNIDFALIEQIKKQAMSLVKILSKGEVPEIPCSKNRQCYACRYCGYKKHCW